MNWTSTNSCIWIVHLDLNADREFIPHLIRLVSVERKCKAEQFHNPVNSLRSLTGDILARFMISQLTGEHSQSVKILREKFGKPITEGCFFNISHSGTRVVGVAGIGPLGIDVEQIRTANLRIAERFFSNEEKIFLAQSQENERFQLFYRIFALKESFLKCFGVGLYRPLRSFSVIPNTSDIIFKGYPGETAFFKSLDTCDGYNIAICAESPFIISKIIHCSVSNLICEVTSHLQSPLR